jgi:hypothetical protein
VVLVRILRMSKSGFEDEVLRYVAIAININHVYYYYYLGR